MDGLKCNVYMLLKGCVNYSCIAPYEGKKSAEILTVDWDLRNQLFQSFSEYKSSLSIISLNYRIKNNSDSPTFKTGELLTIFKLGLPISVTCYFK